MIGLPSIFPFMAWGSSAVVHVLAPEARTIYVADDRVLGVQDDRGLEVADDRTINVLRSP